LGARIREHTMSDEFRPQSTQPLERRLVTILCADVAGYSKMVAANEERTVRVFRGHREIFESLVNLHRGRIFNTAGDALLAEFNSAVEAVRCATEIQAALQTRNEHLAPEEKMQFRMGINLGDVIIQGGDLLGDGVNVAARIQTATAPGGICISGSVYDQIQNKLSLNFKLLGEQTYKNIPKPVRTYTINEVAAVTTPAGRTGWRVPAAITAAALVIAGAGYWGYLQYDRHRTKPLRVDARLADQLAAQKQATEQAQQAAKEAKGEAQWQAQKLAGEERQRRAQEEGNKLEQERTQLEQERKRLEAEKQAAEADRKQAEASQRAASTAAKDAPKPSALHDGSYSGQLCNQFPNKESVCWPVALVVRNGIAEGIWISPSKNTSRALGTVAADGLVQLNLAGWTPRGTPAEARLLGSIVDGAITVSGQWSNGNGITGDWKRKP
jgi:class 3 adenylate cyclase